MFRLLTTRFFLAIAIVTVSGCATWYDESVPGPGRWPLGTTKVHTGQPAPSQPVVRGQTASVSDYRSKEVAPGYDDLLRGPMMASTAAGSSLGNGSVVQSQFTGPRGPYGNANSSLPPPPNNVSPPEKLVGSSLINESGLPSNLIDPLPPERYADIDVNVQETQTGRLMFGVGVNSDLGMTGQIVLDEQNFDWRRCPTSIDDVLNGTTFRGGGQRLRIEAIPGSRVQRYLVNFTEPYLNDTPISLNLSGFFYDRRFFDWDEQRLGGRVGLGRRLTPDLSLGASVRAENIEISDPRRIGIFELDSVVGDTDLYSGRITLTHDTRDVPFAATEGHYLELSYEQVFGEFDYPRGVLDYRRYFLLAQRPDETGRHTLSFSNRIGITGSQTPIFENFFAGGHSTLRGFEFRGASPEVMRITVGGELSLLGSVEYIFPVTADDMLKGALFVDYGTIEEDIEIHAEDFRVSVGFGVRVSIPAMGPAPIALDIAVPINRENTDDIQNFSFFVGLGR